MVQLPMLAGLVTVMVMAARHGVVAQISSNTTDILDALPACGLPCMQTTAQAANCSLTDADLLAGCICTDPGVQYNFASCVQKGCASYPDQVAAFHVESQVLCGAYPKESKQRLAINVSIMAICVALPIVAARCYARATLTKRLWADDYVSVFTLCALIPLAAMEIYGSQKGIGLHYWDLDFGNLALIRQILYAARMFYPLIQCTGKVAILLLYQRVFDVGHAAQWLPITIKVCIGLLLVGESIFILLIAFQCLPVAAIWDKTITDAKCISLDAAYLAGAVLTIGADLILIFLPIPALRRLQISRRKRIALFCVFGIASFGVVASLVRIKYLIVEGSNAYDLTWYYVDVHNWTLIDLLAIVVCGCLPALWPYVQFLLPYLPFITSGKRSTINQSKASGQSSSTAGPNKKASVASFPLSTLSPTNSSGKWREIQETPDSPQLPAQAMTRQDLVVEDVEAAKLPRHTVVDGGVSSNGSQDDLINNEFHAR